MSDEGPSLSEMMDMADVYEKLQSGDLDEEDWEELREEIDVEKLSEAVQTTVVNVLGPHIEDIRNRAQQQQASGTTRFFTRQKLEGLDPAERDQELEQMVGELVVIAAQFRVDPGASLRELKQYIRNPWSMERLLLVFNYSGGIGGANREDIHETKELATMLTRWFAMQLVPGAYTDEERMEINQELGLAGQGTRPQQRPDQPDQWRGDG